MKKSREVLSVVFVFLIAVFLLQSQAWGFAGVEDTFGVEPNAAGTKYSGPLTIYFECVPFYDGEGELVNPCPADVNHMYFFARLNQGNSFYHCSYDAGVVPYDYNSMVDAFRTFIEEKFIPKVCTTSPCPTFGGGGVALKQVTRGFYDLNIIPGYFIANIVIAVQP